MSFKVGDVVRIREWDDMKEEFGLSLSNCIACRFGFNSSMRSLCGKEFVISCIKEDEVFGHGFDEWSISLDMIEPACVRREEFDDDTSDIDCYLGEFIKR